MSKIWFSNVSIVSSLWLSQVLRSTRGGGDCGSSAASWPSQYPEKLEAKVLKVLKLARPVTGIAFHQSVQEMDPSSLHCLISLILANRILLVAFRAWLAFQAERHFFFVVRSSWTFYQQSSTFWGIFFWVKPSLVWWHLFQHPTSLETFRLLKWRWNTLFISFPPFLFLRWGTCWDYNI